MSPKVRLFWWRSVTNSLHMRSALKCRHIIEDDVCPLCKVSPKTLNHALLFCPMVRDAWVLAGLSSLLHLDEAT